MDITLVMSFRNEGEEVSKTCASIRKTVPNIPIICVNDASDDEFDYEKSLKPFNVTYIVNEKPQGCSLAREKAVELCKTKWFIMLDAHCRIYTKDWLLKLKNYHLNEKAIYCCGCIPFSKENDEYNPQKFATGYGAWLPGGKNFLNPKWFSSPQKDTIYEIPVILGANYICTKKWWSYIGGFKGIKRYGRDESLVSIKTHMAGGKVYVIPNIITGHLFRKSAPYEILKDHILYNELAIIKICAPYLFNSYKLMLLRNFDNEIVNKAIKEIEEDLNILNKEYERVKKISVKTFETVYLEIKQLSTLS